MKDTRTWLSPFTVVKVVIVIAVLSCSIARVSGLGVALRQHVSAHMHAGQSARLIDAGRTVTLYHDRATFDAVARLDPEKVSDMTRLQHISESDALTVLPSGTPVRVLWAIASCAYVEITNGPYTGTRGYVRAALIEAD